MRELSEAILALESRDEVERFLRDLCTIAELEAMAHRWAVARLRGRGLPYLEVAREDARLDDDGDAGGALAAPRRGRLPAGARPAEGGDVDRLTIAVPVKGRLREPSVSLLEDAGLGPEQPGERALAFPCRNAPVDVLLVRAADVPEYVQDGVVDCGITGPGSRRASAARASRSCSSSASARAGSRPPCPRSPRYQTLEDLAGATVATVYPRLTRELLPVEVELVDVTGSVEIAPRLGLADAIVDLVSSGNTLRTNGLRSLGPLFSSQAVLIGRAGADAAQLVSMMRAVVEARAHRYLMLNTPEARLDAVCAIIGSRSPSVLPLAEPGMVAVHALVPSADVWRLLPELEAGRRLVDPRRPGGADGAVSIVEEIKREGDAAVRRWALELDGAEPARAVPEPELLPREALLDLADRVRRWHEAQRPADISLEVEPGVRARAPLARRSRRSASTCRATSSRRSSCARCRRRRPASSGSSSARRRPAPGSSPPRPRCSGSTRSGRSAARRRSAGSPTCAASTRSSGPETPT